MEPWPPAVNRKIAHVQKESQARVEKKNESEVKSFSSQDENSMTA